jgi:ABC-type transporter Mla subunit MlaD
MSSSLPAKPAGNNTVIHGTATAAPDNVQRLRQEIEQTRENLGATVEQLAARIDVKSRAQAEAARLADRIKATGAQLRQDAPGYARRAIEQGTKTGREQLVPLSMAASVLVIASLIIWQRRRR